MGKILADTLRETAGNAELAEEEPDIIEMDEIYTYVKKQPGIAVWTAYSRRQGRVIEYHIGKGIEAAQQIYRLTKEAVPRINTIYTDITSCYQVAFRLLDISENMF